MTSSTNHKDRLHQMEDTIARKYHGELLGIQENTHQSGKQRQDPGLTIQAFQERNHGQGNMARALCKNDK